MTDVSMQNVLAAPPRGAQKSSGVWAFNLVAWHMNHGLKGIGQRLHTVVIQVLVLLGFVYGVLTKAHMLGIHFRASKIWLWHMLDTWGLSLQDGARDC